MALEGLKRKLLGSLGLLKGKRKIDEETVRELEVFPQHTRIIVR